MKDKPLIIAASIVGLGFLVLAFALVRVADEVSGARRESVALVERIEKLSDEVPVLAEEAGDQAGRSAVHGAFDEAFVEPLRRLAKVPKPLAGGKGAPGDPTPGDPAPWPMVHVEVVEPTVVIQIGAEIDPSALLPPCLWEAGRGATESTGQPETGAEGK